MVILLRTGFLDGTGGGAFPLSLDDDADDGGGPAFNMVGFDLGTGGNLGDLVFLMESFFGGELESMTISKIDDSSSSEP